MVKYIYFVKCPNCEAEPFDFFKEAKEFAISCLTKKPVITQVECCHNDNGFGERIGSNDLGVVWSWEDMMQDIATNDESTKCVFTKDDLKQRTDDPEFQDDDFFAINNSEESVDPLAELFDANISLGFDGGTGNTVSVLSSYDAKNDDKEKLDELFDANVSLGISGGTGNNVSVLSPSGLGETCSKKPIPDGMTIEELVEAMEENEDTVECTWCNELFDKSECHKEVDLGWLCSRCKDAIMSRGEPLTFRENNYWDFLDENAEEPLSEDADTLDKSAAAEAIADRITATSSDKQKTSIYKQLIKNIPQDKLEALGKDILELLPTDSKLTDQDKEAVKKNTNIDPALVDKAATVWQLIDSLLSVAQVGLPLLGTIIDIIHLAVPDEALAVACPPLGIVLAVLSYIPDGAIIATLGSLGISLVRGVGNAVKDAAVSALSSKTNTDSVKESMDPHDLVELEYPSLTVTLYGEKRAEDDWDEEELTDSHVFLVPKDEVATAIWENWITEEDVKDVEGGLEALEDDAAWEKFLETHFDELFEKYNKQVLGYFEDEAAEDFRERSQEEYQMNKLADRAYWYDEDVEEPSESNELLEESDDAFCAWRSACPECGIEEAFDHAKGKCTQCGFSTKKRIVEEADYGEQDIFELEYEELPVTIGFESVKDPFNPECTPDYTEESIKVSYLYKVSRDELVKALGETILPPETLENPGLPSNPKDLWVYADENLEYLFDRYQTQLLDFFEESAAYAFEDEYSKGYGKAFDQVEAILGDRYESED